ncbi:GNAT family N-acetyltransferase [Alsobacter sp. KACC 23698]|uniref:GNAT family N-acetyltransferase n=1 Tax=Alsobacter sp. KACC 23698 TaxID=3149229 RepID=A0AAU7JAU7_9HYPH
MAIEIRPLSEQDRSGWERLYEGYAQFYKVVQTPEMRARVWGWIMDPAHEVGGLAALDAGRLVGLAHYRPFPRPLSATTGGFLDDLFVDPQARGSGAASALIAQLKRLGQERGWSVIRWITAEDNDRARALYDRVAERTRWVTYDIKL